MNVFYLILVLFLFNSCSKEKTISHPQKTNLILSKNNFGSSEGTIIEFRQFQKGSEDSIIAFYRNQNQILKKENFFNQDSSLWNLEYPLDMLFDEELNKIHSNLPFYIIEYEVEL